MAPEQLPASWCYLGAGPLDGPLPLAAVPDARNRASYLSGPPRLVSGLRRALREAGVKRARSDYFSGY